MGMALILHGGAGDIPDSEIMGHRQGIASAAHAGWSVLLNGGSALDAVQVAITVMEDDPNFDAGRGSFLNREGVVEMDASIMDGRTLDAGAVAGVQRIRNPIRLARIVMESEHTFLIASGAETFAKEHGVPLIENSELCTQDQIAKWREWKINPPIKRSAPNTLIHGSTVGCVAVDRYENIAAGTSTGGMKFKHPGRVGDSPLIGCGTYADNLLGGASTTGWGEAIIRIVLAKYAVDALQQNRDPGEVAHSAIEYLSHRVGGTGGIIVADRTGRIGYAYNTKRLTRAFILEKSQELITDC